MDNRGIVSVIIPVYNHSKYVKQAILSVIEQTYAPVELIVIDDGSTDNSAEIVLELQREYGFSFESRKNKGVSATTNEGIKKSKGNYICFLASDDLFKKDKLKTQVEFLQCNPEFAMCCSLTETVDKAGVILPKILGNIASDSLSFDGLIRGNAIMALTVMIRREIFDSLGYFDESLKVEDWDMWLRVADKYEIGFIPEVLASYRIHDNNTSSDSLMLVEQRLKILSKWKEYPDIKNIVSDTLKRNSLYFAKLGRIDYLRFIIRHKLIIRKSYFIKSFLLFLLNAPIGFLRRVKKFADQL